jgi:serine/threonine protein phosphatase PrpC
MSQSESWKKPRIPVRWIEGFQFQGLSPLQEDRFEVNPERGIFILADGFGGSAGKKAAELVTASVKRFLETEAGDLDATMPFELRSYYSLAGNILYNSVSFANQKLMREMQTVPMMERGGSSLVAGYLEGRLLALANVGACRVHLCREGRIKEIVSPKTLERQVNPFIEEFDSAVPLMSFGTVRQLEPEIIEIELRPGDRLCFSTSGLRQELRDQLLQLNHREEFSQRLDLFRSESVTDSNASAIFACF